MRELDKAIEELLGGLFVSAEFNGKPVAKISTEVANAKYSTPAYSTDPAAMLELIPEIEADGWRIRLTKGAWWHCVLYQEGEVVRAVSDHGWPDAVARAYYKARTGKEWTG